MMSGAMPRNVWGQVFYRKDTDRWCFRYPSGSTASGRRGYVYRTAGSGKAGRKKAERALEECHRLYLVGKLADPKMPGRTTLAEVVHDHVEAEDRPVQTLHAYRRAARRLAAHSLGKKAPADVTPTMIEAWVRSIGGSASTRRGYLAVVSGAFERLVRAGQVQENPVRRTRKPKVKENPHRVLTALEVDALRRAAQGQIRAFVIFALRTGARRGEIVALRWRDIDLEGRAVRIARSKTGNVSTVRLHPEVVDELRRHRAESPDLVRVFPPTRRASGPWRPDYAFAAICRECGIEGAVIHSMRHTFATYFLASGGSLRHLQGILGHASIVTTERYTRMLPDIAGAEVDALRFDLSEASVGRGTVCPEEKHA